MSRDPPLLRQPASLRPEVQRRLRHARGALQLREGAQTLRSLYEQVEDNDANYHNANEFTNLSVHNRIDKLLMDSHRTRAEEINGFSYTSGGEQVYVSPQEMADRVYHKIDAAKATGAMDNERYQNYLRRSAERLNMDMRAFNGC